jgi:hypothetical protein
LKINPRHGAGKDVKGWANTGIIDKVPKGT